MLVLSSLERTPSPEPADKDFYSEFGDKNTGTLSTPRALTASVSTFPLSLPSWQALWVIFHGRGSIRAVPSQPADLSQSWALAWRTLDYSH